MSLNNISQYFLFLMLFSPIISFLTFGQLGLYSSVYYFQLITCVFEIYFILKKNTQIKLDSTYFALLAYLLYIIVWSFFNGYYAEKGILNTTNAKNFSILFILLIINSTKFSGVFLKRSILIIKITVVIAAITSLISGF